jgi:hypothetical protein
MYLARTVPGFFRAENYRHSANRKSGYFRDATSVRGLLVLSAPVLSSQLLPNRDKAAKSILNETARRGPSVRLFLAQREVKENRSAS